MQVKTHKRQAADALRDGDGTRARRAYDTAGAQLDELLLLCPSQELAEEREVIGALRSRAQTDANWAAKRSRMDQSRKSRKRGRPDLGM